MIDDDIQNDFDSAGVKPVDKILEIALAPLGVAAVVDVKERVDGVKIQSPVSMVSMTMFKINLQVNRGYNNRTL